MAPRTLLDRLDIRRIVADGDLDGLVAAAVLRIAWPAVSYTHLTLPTKA